ncbi:hypothetical protein [Pseudarthrobacter sp. N5]|uniref:hypothetical protein n=1 Tax=Pseudarthrobacter sp. N5 TaxID=3418416 RepID=UPI003CEFAB98
MAESTPSGSGGPLRPSEPVADGYLQIRGGRGGIHFQLEELLAGAAELDALAVELTAVEIEARRIWEELCPYQNDPRATGTQALIAVGDGGHAVRTVREEIQDISSQVRASHREYQNAESLASLGLRGDWNGEHLLIPFLFDAGTTHFMNRDSAEALARNVPLAIGLMLGISRERIGSVLAADVAAGRQFSTVGAVIRSLADAVPTLKPRPISISDKNTSEIQLDASPAGLLDLCRKIDAEGHGKIAVVEVENNGKKAFVVVVPGTQPGGQPGGNNPFDEAGIGEGLGYGSEYMNAAIRSALEQAGAEAHDQVVAVGYSQGGIHAMNLSQDKAFLAEYDLKYVLTAGSPVGGITPGPGTSTLHLEHRQDWVPGSDGVPSPDTKDRVTVTLTNPVVTLPGEDPGIGPGHKLSNYEEGARAVTASNDPSLVASTSVLAGVVGAGGAAKMTSFSLKRDPVVPKNAVLRAPGPLLPPGTPGAARTPDA